MPTQQRRVRRPRVPMYFTEEEREMGRALRAAGWELYGNHGDWWRLGGGPSMSRAEAYGRMTKAKEEDHAHPGR